MTLNGFASRALVMGAFLLLFAAPAAAQRHPGKPNPERGAELAVKLCAGCHASKANDAQRVKADVPTFREIAELPGQTPELLTGKIIVPRHPMPTMSLTRSEIADLVAYLQSLSKSD